jgi:hypothetical protein
MSIKEHRRKGITGNAFDTVDANWAGLHSLWSLQWPVGSGLDMGEIIELTPRHGVISIFYEVYDGMSDGALPVAPGTVSITVQLVTRQRVREQDVFEVGSLVDVAVPQRRLIELEVPPQGRSALRVISALNLPVSGALWFFASEDIEP